MAAKRPTYPAVGRALLLVLLTTAGAGAQQIARSADGMVVTSHPLATAAGAAMLEVGGNAIDAGVAAAFVLAVVDPPMTGLGGRTQVLLRLADGTVAGIDGTTQVPRAYVSEPENLPDKGYRSIGVPGTVAALTRALERFGTLPLATVLEPAIRYAEDGFVLQPHQALPPASGLDTASAAPRYFARADGSRYLPGERFRQPALAATLRAIAVGGRDAFYRGEIARRIDADMRAHGGYVRYEDLAAYRAEESLIVRGRYRGRELVGSYWPASGATTIEILQILDRLGPPARDEVEWADDVARASVRAFADRQRDVEPAARKAAWLVSDSLAERRAAEVRADQWLGPVPAGAPESGNTTHLSAGDRWGNAVSMTQSLGNAYGSLVASEGLGFLYAMTMGYLGAEEPGARPGSSQSPLLVLRDGEVEYVLGAAGSRRIISAIVQTLGRMLDQGRPLPVAMALPRLHPDTTRLIVEARPRAAWSEASLAGLRALGWAVEPRDQATYFGRIHGLYRDPETGEWVGVADPRRFGEAAGPGPQGRP